MKKKRTKTTLLVFNAFLICIIYLLFSCTNKEETTIDSTTLTLEQTTETKEDIKEEEQTRDKKELYVGNTILIKEKEYKSEEWEFSEKDFDYARYEFLIVDYDDEKVLVTSKDISQIDYYTNSYKDLKNWKNRFGDSFEVQDVYVRELVLPLNPMALANIVRNEETDSDFFIMSKEEIEKYFINKNIDAKAKGSVYVQDKKNWERQNRSYILRDSYLDDICVVDDNGQISEFKSSEKYYYCRPSMYLKREYVEKLLSGYYDEREEQNKKIKEKYINEKVETSQDGKTAYVKDYTGGRLDVKKYGKYEILDFSKNESDFIVDVDRMFGQWTHLASENRWYYDNEKNEMVYYGNALKEVRLDGLNLENCYSAERMFSGVNVEKIDFSNVNLENVFTCYKMFNECEQLVTVKGLDLNSKNLINLRGAFFKCISLTDLEIVNINTEKVTNMGYMFYRCQSLENLDVSKFNTKNVRDMSYMFGNMRKLKELKLLNFNTEKVQDMSHMFYRCEKLKDLDLSSFKTENLSDVSYMFYCCYDLKSVNISSFDTWKIGNFSYFMYFCNSLEKLDFDNFKNGESEIRCNYMFRYCESLKTLNMRNANLPYLYGKYIFEGCINLVDYNFNMKSLEEVSKDSKFVFTGLSATGSIDDELIYKVENDTEDTTYESYSKRASWNLFENAKNIKKQIDDLSMNKEMSKYFDRQKNIANRDILFMNNDALSKLLRNEFLVKKEYQYMEFYNYYEEARYNHFPNFVTTDSMLHTFHLYFDYLMKKIEKSTLSEKVLDFSKNMLEVSKANYTNLKGTVLENNAKTVVAYFSVPTILLDETYEIEPYVKEIVEAELDKIKGQSYIDLRPLFLEYYKETYPSGMFNEDYTQFIPRGHYTEGEDLEKYFKALMWYGRTNFASDYEDLNKCAMLISCYMNDSKLLKEYKDIKNIIYYFAGESDDNSVEEYIEALKNVYGNADLVSIINNSDKYNNFVSKIKELKLSSINSSPLMFDSKENNVNFRLIGQTYTYDEDIFTNLIFDRVLRRNDQTNKKRYLPDFLDVPASLNSDLALKILDKEDKTNFPNYMENLNKLRKRIPENIKKDDKNILYNKWMRALYRLVELEKNDEKLPSFMRNEEWKKKTLETFAGSYAELKHDTILYTKQTYGVAECGEGGGDEFYDTEEYEIDYKGYVEPVVELYKELKTMSLDMKAHFYELTLLVETDIEFLDNFGALAAMLETISNKELNNIELTKEEYDLIEGYGATIEHLIIDSGAYAYERGENNPQPSSAIVADVATGDRNIGDYSVLEIATGNPIRIFVLVNAGGKYKICQGAAYDFYQFEVEPEKRMNDIEWRTEMGFDKGYKKNKDGKYIDWDEQYAEWYGIELDEGEALEEIDLKNVDFKFQDWTNSYKEKGLMFSERINTYFIDHCGSYRDKNICVTYEND